MEIYTGGNVVNSGNPLQVATVGTVLVKPYGLSQSDWQFQSAAITTEAPVTLKATGGANVRNYITALQYHNTSAVPSEIQILDGGTIIWRGYAPASMAIPATINFPTPLRGTVATATNVVIVTTATNTYVNAQGYQGL